MKPQAHLSHLFRQLTWAEIDTDYLRRLIAVARAEDCAGAGLRENPLNPIDVTTATLGVKGSGSAVLAARRDMRVCGLGLVPLVLEVYGGGHWEAFVDDGTAVPAGTVLGRISGEITVLLEAERILLNFLQRLCGVSTQTARHVAALGDSPTKLLDTRKTTPGFRVLEKYAVACGGAWNHRIGLFDRVMLKDNHLASSHAAAGEALAGAVRRARAQNPALAIEVEVDALEQIAPVLSAAPDVILLDNFTIEQTRQAVALIGERAWTEGSGGVSLESLPLLGTLGLDFISCGAVIHHAPWMDIGLDWEE